MCPVVFGSWFEVFMNGFAAVAEGSRSESWRQLTRSEVKAARDLFDHKYSGSLPEVNNRASGVTPNQW
jgi:hypothetical protein